MGGKLWKIQKVEIVNQTAIVEVQKKEIARIMLILWILKIIWNNIAIIDFGDAYLSIPFLIVLLLNVYIFE